VCPPIVVETTRYKTPPIEFKPNCAKATDEVVALVTLGTLWDAWKVDGAGLTDCAAQAWRLWELVNLPTPPP
jgi:hypothetical protein